MLFTPIEVCELQSRNATRDCGEHDMKRNLTATIAAIALFTALAIPVQLAAQQTRYKFIDIGTFGGPNSFSFFGDARSLNNAGTLVGQADTSIPDPNYGNPNPLVDPDPFIQHGFLWSKGELVDLGALPGTNSSEVSWINDAGVPAGVSTTGELDPITGFPIAHAVVWVKGQIFDLGTLSGGYESGATAINDKGQIAGIASNLAPDENSLFELRTQTRAFVWEHGVMQDLGTLGGTDAAALLMNNRGQIAGFSYDASLALVPFFWEKGEMQAVGGFGGSVGIPAWLNNRGQVVGLSLLSGDSTAHPFLWSRAEGLIDLGTLGGSFGSANWVNEDGEVAGAATTQGDATVVAFIWKNGLMTSLGTLGDDPCSVAININSKGQVVGSSVTETDCGSDSGRAFLWDQGTMIDLNAFVPPGSNLTLTQGAYINNHAEILAIGVLPNGDPRSVLLVPCNSGEKGCRSASESPAIAFKGNSRKPGPLNSKKLTTAFRARFFKRYQTVSRP
jgi:probable HAF family extracellular repeat protein